MKTRFGLRSALLLALAGGAAWAVSLGITLTNHWNQRLPVLLVDGELGSTNRLQYTPLLATTNDWQPLARIIITNHPTRHVDTSATGAGGRYYRALSGDEDPPTNGLRAPVYFNLFYHQEGVGTLCTNPPFPKFHEWRTNFLHELAELDLRGIVSDQYLSDYMVDVIRHHSPMMPDPIFAIFSNSPNARLGYHFHPASADVAIRTDKIRDLEFWQAVATYPIWERAYYDWSPCVPPSTTNCILCGRLDPNNPTGGGIAVMEAAFGKPCVVDSGCGAPEALALTANYPYLVTEAGGAAVHTLLCGLLLPHSWRSNWDLSPDPYRYVYKMMGLYRLRATSLAWIEPSLPLPAIEQMLALLPRDRPHIVMVHGYNRAMSADLDLVQRFIASNPGSRFISASELPALVDAGPNVRTYSMSDLEEGARYLLRNWHGRPPGFIVTGHRYLPLTALFRALQTVLSGYYAQPQAPWPESVTVPEFIPPPLGDQEALPSMDECRTYLPVSVTNLAQIIRSLSTNEIPFVTEVWVRGDGWTAEVKINAAELLHGMCTLFLKHRANELFSEVCLRKGHIIPLSNITNESDCSRCCGTGETPPARDCLPCQPKATYADSRRDWYNQLQLWTLEPLDLRVAQAPQTR